jgi:hypothetical protein
MFFVTLGFERDQQCVFCSAQTFLLYPRGTSLPIVLSGGRKEVTFGTPQTSTQARFELSESSARSCTHEDHAQMFCGRFSAESISD